MKEIDVVSAAIIEQGKILIAQRPQDKTLANYWEFPGGKIETGETMEEALKREIKEELNIDIDVQTFIDHSSYAYYFGKVNLYLYTANVKEGDICLREHSQIKWLEVDDLNEVEWAAADIPLAKQLANYLS